MLFVNCFQIFQYLCPGKFMLTDIKLPDCCFIHMFILFVIVRIKFLAWYMLGKCSITK